MCDSSQIDDPSTAIENKPDIKNEENKEIKKDANQDPYEYYIHYESFNRRLDEWVRRDRMRPLDEDVGEVWIVKRTKSFIKFMLKRMQLNLMIKLTSYLLIEPRRWN